MGVAKLFRKLSKPLLIAAGALAVVMLSCGFLCICFDHQQYVSGYKEVQRQELKEAQQKIATILSNLKQLSELTKALIISSPQNIKQIQEILKSTSLLRSQVELPALQKVVYYKLSSPPAIVTRFGSTSLLKLELIQEVNSSQKEASIAFKDDVVISKSFVFDSQGALQGFLEIKIASSKFKSSLGLFKTLSFDSPASLGKSFSVVQKDPLAIYSKAPDGLLPFVVHNAAHYGIFLMGMAFSFILLLLFVNIIGKKIHRSYRQEREKLRTSLLEVTSQAAESKKEALNYQKLLKVREISLQAYKKLVSDVFEWQQEQASSIKRSLDIINQELKEQTLQISARERVEILHQCLKAIHLLSNGLILKTKNESVDLKDALEKVRYFFAERVYKFNIDLKISYPNSLFFWGDKLFTEIILLNLVGQSLYRVPRNGEVRLMIEQQSDFLHIEIQDNGYFLVDEVEGFNKQSFVFFMEKEVFQKICRESGLKYQQLAAENGSNVAHLVIPTLVPESSSNNVIQMFKGTSGH